MSTETEHYADMLQKHFEETHNFKMSPKVRLELEIALGSVLLEAKAAQTGHKVDWQGIVNTQRPVLVPQ